MATDESYPNCVAIKVLAPVCSYNIDIPNIVIYSVIMWMYNALTVSSKLVSCGEADADVVLLEIVK